MGISLHPEHLKRYSRSRGCCMQVRPLRPGEAPRGWRGALEEDRLPRPAAARREAEELAEDLERLGPTFIKLGQLLSTRAGPRSPCLRRGARAAAGQGRALPVRGGRSGSSSEELGVRLSKAFAEFEPKPIAAASLGQVHRAMLRDGRPVAVKVQRPGIREQIVQDLEALERDRRVPRPPHRGGAHATSSRRCSTSCARRSSASSTTGSEAAQPRHPRRTTCRASTASSSPRPVEDYTTSRVLTMEYVRGRKITDAEPARADGDGRARRWPRSSSRPTSSRSWWTASSTPTRTRATSS